MSDKSIIVIAVVVVVLAVVVALRNQIGSLAVTLFGARVSAKKEKRESKVDGSEAEKNITIKHSGGGSASVSDSKAGGDISITNDPS